jgi:hypothetical protein
MIHGGRVIVTLAQLARLQGLTTPRSALHETPVACKFSLVLLESLKPRSTVYKCKLPTVGPWL